MWLVWTLALVLVLQPFGVAQAAPGHCPKERAPSAAEYARLKHHRHARHTQHYDENDYEAPSPPPAPPMRPARIWHDGYGKPYEVEDRPFVSPPPCPCPPNYEGELPAFCRFDVWYGYNGRNGLQSGL